MKFDTGRYLNIEWCRICDLCNLNTLEDEFHFYWYVLVFVILGKNIFKNTIRPYTWPSIHKYIALIKNNIS